MNIETWNATNFHKSSSQKAVASELANCKLDLVVEQQIGWDEPLDQETIMHLPT
jgi:hypothetical protein